VNILSEVAQCWRFLRKTPEEDRRIVFYSEHEGYWPNFEGLIQELTEEYQQTVCYITSDPDDPVFERAGPRLKVFYSNRLLAVLLGLINCRVLVMTMPELNKYHIKRSVHPVHYTYVFHSPVSTHMAYPDRSFDHYDSLLCVGPHQIREIRKYEELHQLPAKTLIEAGYSRLERIYAGYREYVRANPPCGKKTVLIAPSWGVSNVLESVGERLTEILLENGYQVIVRPHPETVRRTPQLVDMLGEKFGSNPGFTLERSVATNDSLFKSDVLVCDMSGMVIEYALGTERPVLFLDVPYKVRNENFKELGIEPLELELRSEVGVMVSPDELETVPSVVGKLSADRLEYRERLARLREQNIFSFGRSSEVGAQHIIGQLGQRG
jgi:YidC/Oxa1 family membrane protein insertase